VADLAEIKAARRSVLGKKVNTLRRQGQVPANVYGRKRDSVAVQLNAREIEHLLATHSRSQVLTVILDGEQEPALISAVQRHPTRQHVLHVDFQRISLDQPVQVGVMLVFHGEAPAVKQHEAVISHNLTEVTVLGLPALIPSEIDVDISSLEDIDDSVFVRNLTVGNGLEIVTDPDELVARAMRPTVAVEEEPEAAEEGAEAAAAATGEQPSAESESKEESS
jgi:large subunit ribosomal protein L25